MNTVVYYVGLSFFIAHELDAVRRAEWKLLYVLQNLPNAMASSWFVVIHVPLFFLLLWFSHHSNDRLRLWFRLVVSIFLMIHAVLHLRLSSDPAYEFSGLLSNFLIYGAGIIGAFFTILTIRKRDFDQA